MLLVFIKTSQVYLQADWVVNLDFIGRNGEHILHNNRQMVGIRHDLVTSITRHSLPSLLKFEVWRVDCTEWQIK